VSNDSESALCCLVIGRIQETRARVEGVDGRKKSHHDEEAASDIMIYNINKASNFIFISMR
jgi:hypothetical protein